MKCLGLIGGISFEAVAHYARQIDDEVWVRFGEGGAPSLVGLGLQTKLVRDGVKRSDWCALSSVLIEAAEKLRDLGAESIVVCSSLLHVAAADFPVDFNLLHVADSVIAALNRAKTRRIGLLGTRHRDEESMWRSRLVAGGVHDVLLPVLQDRRHISALLEEQFERGIANEEARADVVRIAYSLRQAGARAAVVCVPALSAILDDSVPILPVFDTTELHAVSAVDWMCSEVSYPDSAVTPPLQRNQKICR